MQLSHPRSHQRQRLHPVARIDAAACTGCGRCIAACPLPIIAFETQAWRKFAVLSAPERCTGCGQCEPRCPVTAISMRPAGEQQTL